MQSVFNVSGTLFHPLHIPSYPLEQLEEYLQFETPDLCNLSLERQLCDFLGTEAALVLDNFPAAANLVLSSFVHGRAVTVWGGPNEVFTFYYQLWDRLMAGGAREVARVSSPEPAYPQNPLDKVRISLKRQRCTAVEQYYLAVDNPPPCAQDAKTILLEWVEDPSLADLSTLGLPRRLWVKALAQNGAADLVVFPGGGLIGGPPLGFITGNECFLSRLKNMHLFKQAAPDPFRVRIFKQLLKLYMEGKAWTNVPALAALAAKEDDIRARALALAGALEPALGDHFNIAVHAAKTRLADGEGVYFPTFHVIIKPLRQTAGAVREKLLRGRPAIIPGITSEEALYIDLRTLPAQWDEALREALQKTLREPARPAVIQYMDFMPQLVWITDRQDNLVYLNKPCASFLGLQKSAGPAGQTIQDLLPAELAAVISELKETALRSDEKVQKELCLNDLHADPLWLDLSVSPVPDDTGEITQIMYVACDITMRKKAEEELKQLSLHDSLTGLYNRNYFEEEMKRLNSERHYPISIVIVDIDALKFVNDTLGHQFGDRLLKSTASILKGTFRASDVVARIGGDEFAVILPLTDAKTAQNVLERVEPAVSAFNQTHNGLPLILSFGVATGNDAAENIMKIFKKADDDMYKHKLAKRPHKTQQIVDALLQLMYEKSFITENELSRLQQITGLLGRYVGLSEGEISRILLLCKVYNIGRITLDDTTLLKPGELSPLEWEAVRRSPEAGYRIASSLPGLDNIANCILQHRERWDGSGYPQGLKGEEIHLYSRILAVVDAYQAMLSPRPYRDALRHEEALRELQQNKGTQFDPRITDIFIGLMEQHFLKMVN